METTADRIRHLRKEVFKVSQEVFGRWAGGLSKAAVSQWERDTAKPERDALMALQRHKGVNPEWIMKGKGDIFSKQAPERIADEAETGLWRLIESYKSLPEDRRKQLVGIAEEQVAEYLVETHKNRKLAQGKKTG